MSQNIELEVFAIGGSDITTLDLSQNINLTDLNFEGNLITNLDLTNNLLLEYLDVRENHLVTLDLSQNSNLISVICHDNSLENLNIKNGNNTSLIDFYGKINPDLNCIQVDDVDYANNNQYWHKDETAVFSEDCSLLETNDIESVSEIILYPNPVNTVLNLVSQYPIKSIQVFNILGNLVFDNYESLNQIDFSNYTSGLYFIEIETEHGTMIKKIVKQ